MITYDVVLWKGAKIDPHNRYKLLSECERALAVGTFQKNKNFYHPICRNMVEKDLFGKGGNS